MRYAWIDEYLLGKEGVTKDLQQDWNWVRYQIGGKMFAAVCLDKNDKPYYITLKLEPSEGDFLRQQYEDIVPGYYMNKVHWNSIKPDGAVPDELLKDILDKSYRLVLGGFSKKKQQEILKAAQPTGSTGCCGTDSVSVSYCGADSVPVSCCETDSVPVSCCETDSVSVSCCGADCSGCGCFGTMCRGCNASLGKVFHVPEGQACPIYQCAINEKGMKGCGECGEIPCGIWRKTKDPAFTEEEFERNIQERVNRLKQGY